MLLKNNSRMISFSGIVLAFNAIVFLLINIIPTNTIFLFALASLFPAVILLEFNFKVAIIYNIAQIILSALIIANKIYVLSFLFSFSIYALYKAFIEYKIKNFILEYILKLIYATISIIIVYYFVGLFIKINVHWWFVITYYIAFLVYDFFFSQAIAYYKKNIKKLIKNRKK